MHAQKAKQGKITLVKAGEDSSELMGWVAKSGMDYSLDHNCCDPLARRVSCAPPNKYVRLRATI
jgi:hypothetical protein